MPGKATSLDDVEPVVERLAACSHHQPSFHTPRFDAAASWYWRHRAAVAAPRDPGVVEARRLRKLRKAQAKARSRTAKAR